MNIALWSLTILLLSISFIKSKKKTVMALKKAYMKIKKMLPLFLFVMAAFAIIITYIPTELIEEYIGVRSGYMGIVTAIGLGSVSVMPGFAAFPLCAALRLQGVPLYIIAALSISLMTIGIASFPLEKKYLGTKVAITRNVLAIVVTVITVAVIKFVFGE